MKLKLILLSTCFGLAACGGQPPAETPPVEDATIAGPPQLPVELMIEEEAPVEIVEEVVDIVVETPEPAPIVEAVVESRPAEGNDPRLNPWLNVSQTEMTAHLSAEAESADTEIEYFTPREMQRMIEEQDARDQAQARQNFRNQDSDSHIEDVPEPAEEHSGIRMTRRE